MPSEPDPVDVDALLTHSRWVRGLARSLLFDQDRVDDVVQQAWVVALQQRPHRPEALRAWLGGIVRNLVRRQVRSETRRARHEASAAVGGDAPSTHDLVAQADMHRRVVGAVLELAEPYRSTVLLRYFEGLTAEQIARRLDVPGSTVRVRLKRALDQLRRRLDGECGSARRSWSVGLIPLALSGNGMRELAVGTAVTTGMKGVVAMTMNTKLVVSAFGLGAVLLGLWWVLDSEPPSHPARAGAVLPVSSMDQSGTRSDLRGSVAESEVLMIKPEGQAAPNDSLSDAAADRATPGELTIFTGRVVEPDRTPVSGAVVYLLPSREVRDQRGFPADFTFEPVPWDRLDRADTAEGGRFELSSHAAGLSEPAVLLSEDGVTQHRPHLVIVHPGHMATVRACTDLMPGRYDAGDIVVRPGAVLIGRVVDADEVAIQGALVAPLPYQTTSRAMRLNEDWSRVRTTMQDVSAPDGSFRLSGLWPGELGFRVSLPGFAPTFQECELVAGEVTDLGDVMLVSGRRIEGTVENAEGEPVADAFVKARSAMLSAERDADFALADLQMRIFSYGQQESETHTDANGRFVFDGLTDDEYTVLATAPGHDATQRRDVASGTKDLRLTLPPEATILLHVVDGVDRMPVPDVSVEAQRVSTRQCDARLEARTGAEAAHAAALDGAGTGLVLVEKAGRQGTRIQLSAEGYAGLTHEVAGVEPGSRLEQTVELEVEASITGRITNADGEPVAHAWVQADDADGAGEGAATDQDGLYRIGRLGTGERQLTARAAGYAASETIVVTLAPRQTLRDVDFVLSRGARLSGIVHGAAGWPVADVDVSVRRVDAPHEQPGKLATDMQGRFAFDQLRPGNYAVAIPSVDERLVTLEAGDDIEIVFQLRRPPLVRGRVTDASGPVQGATVEVQPVHRAPAVIEGDRRAETDQAGEYTIEPGGPGDYVFVAYSDGARTPTVLRTLQWNADELVDLSFGHGRLQGVVRDVDTEMLLAGMRIAIVRTNLSETDSLMGGAAANSRRATTDGQGRFGLDRLPSGRYELTCSGGVYEPKILEVDVLADGEHDKLEIELVRGAVITGRVSTVDGSPLPEDLAVSAYPAASDEELRTIRLDDRGQFRLQGLPPGRFTVRVQGATRTMTWTKGVYETIEPKQYGAVQIDVLCGAEHVADVMIDPAGIEP